MSTKIFVLVLAIASSAFAQVQSTNSNKKTKEFNPYAPYTMSEKKKAYEQCIENCKADQGDGFSKPTLWKCLSECEKNNN